MRLSDSDKKPGNVLNSLSDVQSSLDLERGNESSGISTTAVLVQDAKIKYGTGPPVLNNFSMRVQQGTIYGLLGASGCGKTTILSCITGLRKLDSGDIKVFGTVPGTKESGIPGRTIGYMPQETALYKILSIKEILEYFGRIYGMSQSEIESRMEFLLNFLDLPDRNRRISGLSGGESRRSSLAVAMIHQPQLLILDEPTVGVDPLVRGRNTKEIPTVEGWKLWIWEHLCEIVAKQQTTVIITTHYIEEARQSNTVGLMRNGRLLIEKPPLDLLEEYNATLLEDIVLSLCKKDNLLTHPANCELTQAVSETSFGPVLGLSYKTISSDNDPMTLRRRSRSLLKGQRSPFYPADLSTHFNKLKSLTIKNFLTLVRCPTFLFVCLLIPVIQIILFNLIIGKDPKNTAIGVVNHEFPSTVYLEDSCFKTSVGCFGQGLSCKFLNIFPQEDIKWPTEISLCRQNSTKEHKINPNGRRLEVTIPFESEAEALESVEKATTLGFISIPHNFTSSLRERLLYRNFATNESLDGSEIRIRLDMSFNIRGLYFQSLLYKYYLEFIQRTISECGGDPRIVELPLQYKPVYGTVDGGLIDYIQPAQILVVIFLLPMASGMSFIWDKKAGTLDRTLVAGVDFSHYLAAFIISEGLLIIIQLTFGYGVLFLFFDFSVKGSIWLMFPLWILQGITGLSFGFLFGTLCYNEIEVMMCIIALYIPSLISSGATWPLESVNLWVRSICYFLPVTLPIKASRSIVNQGWGITDAEVWQGFASLIAWTVVCCSLSAAHHRFKK